MAYQPLNEPAAFVACRTLGHSWDQLPMPPDGLVGLERTHSGVWLRLRCTRCGMERFDEVSKLSGYVEYRRYVQPDGYKHSADEAIPRDHWRFAYLRLTGVVKDKRRNPVLEDQGAA